MATPGHFLGEVERLPVIFEFRDIQAVISRHSVIAYGSCYPISKTFSDAYDHFHSIVVLFVYVSAFWALLYYCVCVPRIAKITRHSWK